MDYGLLSLILEIGLDAVLLVLGIILIVKAGDNRLRFAWGIMVTFCALLMLKDNIHWLRQPDLNAKLESIGILSIPRMWKWYLYMHTFSLFPQASLRPGWLTLQRVLLFSLPFIFTSVVILCFYWFNGYTTPVYDLSEVLLNIHNSDIQVRLGLFIISVTAPLINILTVFSNKWLSSPRRAIKGMYLYLLAGILLFTLYIPYTLNVSEVLFSIFGYVVIFLPIAFSILYLRHENPLSVPVPEIIREQSSPEQSPEEKGSDIISPAVYKLYIRMTLIMKMQTPFTDVGYSIDQLAEALHASRPLLVKAIQYGGFTGFREYINFLRIDHFKTLAEELPGISVKELTSRCGLTSQSNFSRHFSEQEGISPEKYLEQLHRQTGNENPATN